jgi:NhaP-type Na+/H+ and K+/H+ antiporter
MKAPVLQATARLAPWRLGLAQLALGIAQACPPRETLILYYIEPSAAVAFSIIADIPLPLCSGVLRIVRADEFLAPGDDVELRPGDRVFVFCRPEDRPFVGLLFGRAEHELDI